MTGPERRAAALLLSAGLLLAAPGGAGAVTPQAAPGGVAFPDTVAAGGTTLVRNGAGLRVFFLVVKGYASALYLPAPAHDLAHVLAEKGPKEIRTVFLHGASVDQLRAELRRIHDAYCAAAACGPAEERDYALLVARETPVRAGDTETVLVTGGGVEIRRDGAAVLAITDPRFGDALLGSMLGPGAPTRRYRDGLLGLAG